AVDRRAAHQPRWRVQPVPECGRRHDRARLRAHRQYFLGQRPDRAVRTDQLLCREGRHARLHDGARTRGREEGRNRELRVAGLLQNRDGHGRARGHPQPDHRLDPGRPPRRAARDRAHRRFPRRRGCRFHHRREHPGQRWVFHGLLSRPDRVPGTSLVVAHPMRYGRTLRCPSERGRVMLNYAIGIFAVAAVGGLYLASHVLRGKFAPWAVSALHALLGAAGLVVLLFMVLQGGTPGRLTAALGLLVVAALGGFYLASIHLRREIAPKAVVFVHAGVAVVGFLTSLSLAFG